MNDVRIFWVKCNTRGVRLVRRPRKSPLFYTRYLTQTRKLCPALAQIVAKKQMCRLRTRINSRSPIDQLAGKRIDFLVRNPLVSLLPGLALIRAGENFSVVAAAK